jgi:hypothetical protein
LKKWIQYPPGRCYIVANLNSGQRQTDAIVNPDKAAGKDDMADKAADRREATGRSIEAAGNQERTVRFGL